MTLGAAESKALWQAVQTHNLTVYRPIYSSLLPPTYRNIPVRIYLPSSMDPEKAGIKVLQAHIPPTVSSATGRGGSVQTLGTALRGLIPNLFPSSRTPIMARALLHGVFVPLGAHLEELCRSAAYADGWLGIVIAINA